MRKCKRVWCNGGEEEWYITTWRESRYGGKRRFLKTRVATQQEIDDERRK